MKLPERIIVRNISSRGDRHSRLEVKVLNHCAVVSNVLFIVNKKGLFSGKIGHRISNFLDIHLQNFCACLFLPRFRGLWFLLLCYLKSRVVVDTLYLVLALFYRELCTIVVKCDFLVFSFCKIFLEFQNFKFGFTFFFLTVLDAASFIFSCFSSSSLFLLIICSNK